nr:TetR-like C-terminal domain-containing protein [Cellulomonas sp. IC4_254]
MPDTGTLRADLLAYGTTAATDIAAPGGLALVRAALEPGARDTPAVRTRRAEVLAQRAAEIQEMLDRAVERGEPALDYRDVIDGLLAPIYLRQILQVDGIDDAHLVHLVDRVLATAAVRPVEP